MTKRKYWGWNIFFGVARADLSKDDGDTPSRDLKEEFTSVYSLAIVGISNLHVIITFETLMLHHV